MVGIDTLLSAQDKAARLRIIKEMKESGITIPISLAKDLLCLNFDLEEKYRILAITSDSSKLDLEYFITDELLTWDQNLAAYAIDKWAEETEHLLWFRFIILMKKHHTPQRVKYKILDYCHFMAASHIIFAVLESDGIEEFSPAFHSLLIKRALQWNINSERIDSIARNALSKIHSQDNNSAFYKVFPQAITWLIKYDKNYIFNFLKEKSLPEYWHDYIQYIYPTIKQNTKAIHTNISYILKSDSEIYDKMLQYWPPIWQRNNLSSAQISNTVSHIIKKSFETSTQYWHFFTGCSTKSLFDALLLIDDPFIFAQAAFMFKGNLVGQISENITHKIKEWLVSADEPENLLQALPGFLRFSLNEPQTDREKRLSEYLIKSQESDDNSFPDHSKLFNLDYMRKTQERSQEDIFRNEFFDVAFRGQKCHMFKAQADSFWKMLTKNWIKPDEKDLGHLSTLARQAPSIFKTCYIRTLQQFNGSDVAALKLLDFIRTKNDHEMQAIIHALHGIGTSRALQELIALITRPNVSHVLKIEICELLKNHDLRALQPELRSSIDDLSQIAEDGHSNREIKEALVYLLSVSNNFSKNIMNLPEPIASSAEQNELDLDQSLRKKIPNYKDLSSEVKSSLRTAEFFYKQVSLHKSLMTIDLSPIIDMQYKALELLFRQYFEEPCFIFINNGILQRKLDILGYARPVEKAMAEFEDYIGSLEIICDIPYFSKFKLRKLLRALCLYRPGKRFTLDGIKAFALFFICFSRRECKYGLAGLIPLHFSDDRELAKFCKTLHIFQDFRNRAAHEGFRPQARNDIEGLWLSTADIIDTTFKIKDHLEQLASSMHRPHQHHSKRISSAS